MNTADIIAINFKNNEWGSEKSTPPDNLIVPVYRIFPHNDDYKILFQPNTLNIYLIKNDAIDVLEKLSKNGNSDFDSNLISKFINCALVTTKNDEISNSKVDDKIINKHSKKLFLHVSHNCNLGCPYCYAEGGDYGRNKQMMSLKTAFDSINYTMQKDPDLKEISIDFFGGEPLLNFQVIEQFIESVELKYLSVKFKYGIVTNGTVMNDKIKNMMKKHQFHVMITIDGPKEYHDLQRVYANGKGSFDELVKNLPDFKESANYLCARVVYGRKNNNLYKIFKYIYEELDIHDISYRPVMTDLEEYKLDAESENFAIESLIKSFDYFLEKKLDGKEIESKFFSEQILKLMDRKIKKSFCDFGNFMSITPEGNMYPCTHFVYNDKFEIGNIYKISENTDVLKNCKKSSCAKYEPCKSCWILGLCSGGCKGSAAFYNKDNLFINDEYCKTRMAIVERAIKTIVQSHENNNLEKLKQSLIKDKDETTEMSPNRWR
ncbi:MAG: radical SAM protein [Oscillospiraceae bacterium]|jgi:uncharacterized protein|nr:radical SAM protein [Oscillospiraceae bacterium]